MNLMENFLEPRDGLAGRVSHTPSVDVRKVMSAGTARYLALERRAEHPGAKLVQASRNRAELEYVLIGR